MGHENQHEIVLDKSNFIQYWEDTKSNRSNQGFFTGGMSVATPERGIPSKPVYWQFEDGRKERMTAYAFGYIDGVFVRKITLLNGEIVDV